MLEILFRRRGRDLSRHSVDTHLASLSGESSSRSFCSLLLVPPTPEPLVSSLENKLALIWCLGTFTGRTASVHKDLLQICRFPLQAPPCVPRVLSSSSWTSSLKASASFMSEEEGDGASETTVNITKSPVTPKGCPTS